MMKDKLSEDERKRSRMSKLIEKENKEASQTFLLSNVVKTHNRKILPGARNKQRTIKARPRLDYTFVSEYPSFCIGEGELDLSNIIGEQSEIASIFSGTQTPLDPFCSIEESQKEMVVRNCNDDIFTDGNIFDLFIDEDGMIRHRSEDLIM